MLLTVGLGAMKSDKKWRTSYIPHLGSMMSLVPAPLFLDKLILFRNRTYCVLILLIFFFRSSPENYDTIS